VSRTLYGGQAVIEGVMMKGPRDMAVAVRNPEGDIVLHAEALEGALYHSRWARLPFVRGAVVMWDMLVLGMRTLVFSANVALASRDEPNAPGSGTADGREAHKSDMPSGILWGTMAVSLGLAVGIFFVLPVLVMGVLDRFLYSSVLSNLLEKVIRLTFILGYMWGIGHVPDIARVFAYHGAEHKTVNAHEAGAPLDVEHVRRFTTVHPRCGTTFLIIVVVVSFLVFALLGQPPLVLRIVSRVVLLPAIAGIAYEVMRLAANNIQRPLVRGILAPGLAVQRLTTREPDDSMLEAAIAALKAVIAMQEAREAAQAVPAVSSAVAAQASTSG
jgi:uncharacterized protein YqhQ